MLAEIITIGDEILIGQIVDTNSAYISAQLNKIGVQVFQITSIQDDKSHILTTLEEAERRADIILITGGLGPTKDDITKQTFCDYFNDSLVENAQVKTNIERIFRQHLGRDPLPSNLLQAMVPSKSLVLENEHGTAPGMWMEVNSKVFVSMPGVPYEMKALMEKEVLPRLIEKYDRPFIYHKTLLTYGMGESEIQELIKNWENELPTHIKLAYLPSLGRVRLRLSSIGKDRAEVIGDLNRQMNDLSCILSDIAIGYEDETSIVEKIANIMVSKNETLSLAESCTGGGISEEITSKSGVSKFLKGSIIPYETIQKVRILGVEEQLIHKYGVVSSEVAISMAKNAKRLFESDYAISTTGIAGPTAGDGDASLGTVFIAIATPYNVFSKEFNFGQPRERVISKAINKSLEIFLKEISKN